MEPSLVGTQIVVYGLKWRQSRIYILFVLVLPDSTIFSGSQNVIYIKSSEHVSTL